jgi:hypothetical protein
MNCQTRFSHRSRNLVPQESLESVERPDLNRPDLVEHLPLDLHLHTFSSNLDFMSTESFEFRRSPVHIHHWLQRASSILGDLDIQLVGVVTLDKPDLFRVFNVLETSDKTLDLRSWKLVPVRILVQLHPAGGRFRTSGPGQGEEKNKAV